MLNLEKVIGLFGRLDTQTVTLFMRFVDQVMNSSDPNAYLQKCLLQLLQPEEVAVKVERVYR